MDAVKNLKNRKKIYGLTSFILMKSLSLILSLFLMVATLSLRLSVGLV